MYDSHCNSKPLFYDSALYCSIRICISSCLIKTSCCHFKLVLFEQRNTFVRLLLHIIDNAEFFYNQFALFGDNVGEICKTILHLLSNSFWKARYRRQSQRKIPSKQELSLQSLSLAHLTLFKSHGLSITFVLLNC